MPLMWAAYKTGRLASLGVDFEDGEMDAAAFKARFTEETVNYDGAWTLSVPTQTRPVGVILGFWPNRHESSPYMIVGDMVWFPWATGRNKIETAVHFFNEMRNDLPFMEFAAPEHKDFFVTIAKHGIMRRVGTSYNVYPDQATSVFETRAR